MGVLTAPDADRGAGPFVTLRHLDLPTGPHVWLARDHRKGLARRLAAPPVWQTVAYNLSMASGFGIGATLFAVGAAVSLSPALAALASMTEHRANQVFFAGSIFFTAAAYLQLFQAANAAPHPGITARSPSARALLGWRPKDPGWLASAVQFAGTLLFNANTYDALRGGGGWLRQDLAIWVPDILGSILFLISGYLTMIETFHAWWAFRPRSLAWWIVVVNFLGCVAFMISALCAFVPPGGLPAAALTTSVATTLAGALGFLIGAVLTFPESIGARRR